MSDRVAKPERPKPDPKPLTPEYHKARKQLMLWAAILFIWELVGVDLEKAKEVGGNAGAIISAIKSPQAVPWVLLILIGYFLFKTSIEWYQCPASRRTLRVSKIDFGSAWTVSIAAIALYTIQAISRIQLADRLPTDAVHNALSLFVGIHIVLVIENWRTRLRLIHAISIAGNLTISILTYWLNLPRIISGVVILLNLVFIFMGVRVSFRAMAAKVRAMRAMEE